MSKLVYSTSLTTTGGQVTSLSSIARPFVRGRTLLFRAVVDVLQQAAPKFATPAGRRVVYKRAIPPKLKTVPVTDADVKGFRGR